MSTLTLTIGGANFLPQYQTNSAKITENLLNQGNTMTMRIVKKAAQTAPAIGKEIIFKDGSRFLFGGFITRLRPVEYGVGQLIVYELEASDYTFLLVNKLAQSTYENMTLGAIVADLLATYIAPGYGITGNHVAAGPTIVTVNFNHISMRQAFENLYKITGYVWWVDYQKDVHFVDPGTAAPAPETITDAVPGNHETVVIVNDNTQVRNSIVVEGGIQESNNYAQVILGDANAREWVLVYPVVTMVSVELDTGSGYVVKTVGVDPKDDEASFYAMYSPDRGSLRISTGQTTPGATHKLRVTFTYPLPVITIVQSAPSITALKAIEGGDGVHAWTIQDTTIVSNAQAKQRALKELDQFANPTISGTFVTRTGLLQAGSYFIPGQILTVNLPSWGIPTDTPYMILKVTTTMQETGSSIEYTYTVVFGGRLLGVIDFLQALATPEQPLDTSQQVTKIQAVAEVVTVAEVITKNSNVRSIAETVTVAESFSTLNTVPPFKWAASATKKAIWGKFEWG